MVYAGSEEVGGMQHPFAVYISIPSVAILTTGFPITHSCIHIYMRPPYDCSTKVPEHIEHDPYRCRRPSEG